MCGRGRGRAKAAIGLAAMLVLSACQSGDVEALPPEEDVAESTTSSSTTETTVAPTSTETTLSELAEAEAAIEAAIVGWWTFPRDSSLGDEGTPVEYITGAMFQRLKAINEQRTNAGEIQRSSGESKVRIVETELDLEAGSAKVDVCTLGLDELVDAATGDVLFTDVAIAFTGIVTAERVSDDWKVADFFTTQGSQDPVECELD